MGAVVELKAIVRPEPVRMFQLEGDMMAPDLRSGDFLIIAKCDRFQYDAVYLLDFGHGECPYVCQRMSGRVHIRIPNPVYTDHDLTVEQFEAGVVGLCVAEVRVKDRHYLRSIL